MVSLEDVLWAWRQSIFFSEKVRLEDGRIGLIADWNADRSKLVVSFGRGHKNEAEFSNEELFPFWWPYLLAHDHA